jgi:SPP1 gp7 family putative phage head morphogenesis protein
MTIEWEQLRLLFIEDIQREMKRWYPQLLENAWLDAGSTLGLDIAFDLSNPRVQDVLDELLTKVMGVADTTIEEARALIGRQASEGWSVEELARQLREIGVTQSKTRAQSIAVTEMARGYSLGSQLAWKESNVVSGQEWLVTDPCPVCEPLAGKIVKLDEAFADGIYVPGDTHPLCRCSLAPVVE